MISLISYYADLAIGLILAFLLLSLLVSGVNEGIVRLLGIRSKFLWAYLRDTLDGAETADGASRLDRILDALKRLGRTPRTPPTQAVSPEEGRSRLPASLVGVFARLPFGRDPRPAFSQQPPPVESPPLAAAAGSVAAEQMTAGQTGQATAAGETVDPAHPAGQADPEETAVLTVEPAADGAVDGTAVGAAVGVLPPDQGMSMAELLHERLQEIDHAKRGRTSIADIPPARFAVAVMEIATEHGGVEALMRDLDALKSPFSRPLKAVWDRASHDLEAFRHGVEDWFDGEMERLSLLYRRYVRWVIVALGLVVTLVFSMDSLEYGKTLLRDNAYRSAVTAFGEAGPQALEPLREQCEPGQDPYACVTDVLSTPAFVKIFTHAPVSVTMDAADGPAWGWHGGDWWQRLTSPAHWPGFLITLIALLFGAPFWWDILRRVSGLRTRTSGSTSS
ncbi:hypothetical protein SAMN05421833_101148 [Microbispora rosea]|uniref:Uncharacterized protein n=1 Tax=Microbispora rosea TaxID=58117 RepID=A0A1N6QWH4_9ACTN|nr:hypothetical protein [Microbispora rosea]SIQ20939.1 hypothetical protein SAMN05421833_101148 [Microbispora rosea]